MLNMTNKKSNTLKQQKITIAFGYGLFALVVLGVIISSVIPLGGMLFDSRVLHFNVAMILVAFVASALLPALFSYLIGDRSTHNKSKTAHHYNGVLFGVAAYWFTLLIGQIGIGSFINYDSVPIPWFTVIINWFPVIATVVVMAIVAASFAKHYRKKESVLQHFPYQVLVIGSMVGTLIYSLSQQYYVESTYAVIGLLYIVIPLVVLAVAYKLLRKVQPAKAPRLTLSVVSVGLAAIAASLPAQIFAYAQYTSVTAITSFAFAGVVFFGYIYLLRRNS